MDATLRFMQGGKRRDQPKMLWGESDPTMRKKEATGRPVTRSLRRAKNRRPRPTMEKFQAGRHPPRKPMARKESVLHFSRGFFSLASHPPFLLSSLTRVRVARGIWRLSQQFSGEEGIARPPFLPPSHPSILKWISHQHVDNAGVGRGLQVLLSSTGMH